MHLQQPLVWQIRHGFHSNRWQTSRVIFTVPHETQIFTMHLNLFICFNVIFILYFPCWLTWVVCVFFKSFQSSCCKNTIRIRLHWRQRLWCIKLGDGNRYTTTNLQHFNVSNAFLLRLKPNYLIRFHFLSGFLMAFSEYDDYTLRVFFFKDSLPPE